MGMIDIDKKTDRSESKRLDDLTYSGASIILFLGAGAIESEIVNVVHNGKDVYKYKL